MISEVLQALGSWELHLAEETPQDILDQLDWYGHLAVAPGAVDVEAVGDGMLTGARYVGVLRGKTDDKRGLTGSSMAFWLGDEDDKASTVLTTAVTLTNATLAAAVAAVLPATVTVGTIYAQPNPAARYTGKHQYQTPRKALGLICDAFGVEFRVNGNGTIDVGPRSTLYKALPGPVTPAPMIVRKSAGADLDVVALAGDVDTTESVADWTSDVVLLGQSDDTGLFATGTASAPSPTPYKDLFGHELRMWRMISDSAETTSSVTARSQLKLNEFNRIRRAFTLHADEYESEGTFRVGDDVYVHDQDLGIINPANEVTFRGELLHPDVVRCSGIAWPVTEGMTVGFRRATGVWLDLTPYVTWETGGGDVTIGDLPTSLSRSTDTTIPDRLDANAGRGDTPQAPTGLGLSTVSVIDPVTGVNSATIQATWSAPTQNTDNTALVDLEGFVVQYRPQFRAPSWFSTRTPLTTIELPAVASLPYDVRVAAVDKSGNVGAYTATSSITAAADAGAPPAPQDPTITAGIGGQLKAIYTGKDSSGNNMPKDTNRIEVESAPTSTGPWTVRDFLTPFAAGVAYVPGAAGATTWVRMRAVDNAGNLSPYTAIVSATAPFVTNGDISSLSVGKLIAGTVTADIIMGGRIGTASTGARREMNGVGFQAWDALNNLIINLDGINNLLVGQFFTGLAGTRHTEITTSSDGTQTRLRMFAPDGTYSELASFTAVTGDEAVHLSMPITGTHQFWNTFQIQFNELAFLNAEQLHFGFAGVAAGNGSFLVSQANSKGTVSVQPTLVDRFSVYDGGTGFYLLGDPIAVFPVDYASWPNEGWLEIGGRHGVADSRYRSPRMKWLTESSTGGTGGIVYGGNLKFVIDSGGVNQRFEFTNVNDNGYEIAWALDFHITSSEQGKQDVVDFTDSALDRLRPIKVKQYRMKVGKAQAEVRDHDGRGRVIIDPLPDNPSDVRIGVIAERAQQAWPFLTSPDGSSMSLAQWVTALHAAVLEIADRLDGPGGWKGNAA